MADEDKVTMSQEGWEAVQAERVERMFGMVKKALSEGRLVKIEQEAASRVVKKACEEGSHSIEFARDVVLSFTFDTGQRELIEAESAEELAQKIQDRRV